MGPDLFQKLFLEIDITLGKYIFNTVGKIIVFVKPIFNSLLVIWIAIWGYLAMMGQTNEPLKDGVFRILRITFILALGLTVGTYMRVVVNLLSKGPEQIAGVIISDPSIAIGASLDELYVKVFEIVDQCFEKGGLLNGNFGMYLLGFLMMIIGTALLLSVAFFIISAKIMTAILLGVGPIFIAFLLFKSTQRFFESWLNMLINFAMILILTVGLGTITLELANSFICKMGFPDGAMGDAAAIYAKGLTNIDSILKLVVVFGITILLMLQVPSMASALGGGIALGTQSIIGSTMKMLLPTKFPKGGLKPPRPRPGGSNPAYKKSFNSITGK
jgi:type IV secretion system protein VirB6